MKRANTINFGPAGAAEAASQAVSPPLARSPAALVVYAAHATHALFDTRSFVAHRVAVHVVSPPYTGSPAARVDPAGHATHAPLDTRWFVAHAAPSARVSVIVCLVTVLCPAAYPAEISTLNTLVRSAGAVHVNCFVPEAP